MTERLIEFDEYTLLIISCVDQIKYRMDMTGVQYTDDSIRVFEHEKIIYILANPILGSEPIFDEFGNFKEMIPMYNLTAIFDNGSGIETKRIDSELVFSMSVPRLRILRPDLCMRIEKGGIVN